MRENLAIDLSNHRVGERLDPGSRPRTHAMATPDIGTTISDGYSRGIDRLSATAPSVAIIAVAVGIVAGIIAQVQASLITDTVEEAVNAAFNGGDLGLDGSNRMLYFLLGAVSQAVTAFVMYVGIGMFGGAAHKFRHGGPDETATPAEVPGEFISVAGSLMPKLAILVALSAAGPLATGVGTAIGGLVTLAATIASVYLGVQWMYAPIIAGSGEATGDAAFERSTDAVRGSWWPTLGVWIVIGLATLLPVGIVAAIVSKILPGVFLGAFGMWFILALGALTIYAAAMESGWHQIEGADAGGSTPPAPAPETSAAAQADAPAAAAPPASADAPEGGSEWDQV